MMENVEKTMKEDRQKQDKKQFRYNTPYSYDVLDDFGVQLIGKILTFELANNKIVTGKLKGYGQFDVLLTDSRTGQDFILMKHAIVSVQGAFHQRKEENSTDKNELNKEILKHYAHPTTNSFISSLSLSKKGRLA